MNDKKDYNSLSDKEKKTYDKEWKIGAWVSQHPFLSVVIALFALSLAPTILRLIISFSVFSIVVILGFIMAWITVTMIDSMLTDIQKDSKTTVHTLKTAGKAEMKPDNETVNNWKAKDSYAPDALLALAKDGLYEAKLISAKYDEMLRLVDEAGKDANMIAAEYSSKMASITEGLQVYDRVLKNKKAYPDADELIATTSKAVESLINQFHDTVLEANRSTVFDTSMKMQTIINSEKHDVSDEIMKDYDADDSEDADAANDDAIQDKENDESSDKPESSEDTDVNSNVDKAE